MPEISRFHGITIRMFAEAGARHHHPHFHAYYQDSVGVFSIHTCELIAGDIPGPQYRLVVQWAALHREELLANWNLLQSGCLPVKIEPLK